MKNASTAAPPRARPLILSFNRTYLPGYKGGGPVRTLANMVEQLGDRFEFRIVTQDRDAGSDAAYPGIAPDAWTPVGKGAVRYLPPAGISVQSVARIVRDVAPDIVYLNSFFDRVFTHRVLLARRLGLLPALPVILAPRGEFSAGALGYKRMRKRGYLGLFRAAGVGTGLVWQASTPLEQADIHRALPGLRPEQVVVACDLAAPPVSGADAPAAGGHAGPLRVLFLSRISRMKNLEFALDVLARVRVPVTFSIVGPRDEPYWMECQPALRGLPANVAVEIHDAVSPADVMTVMRGHDLFFLPTRGENFGHVIHEALNVGLPVLISDRTPWSGVAAAGAGWAFPLAAPEPFVQAIEHCAALDAPSREALRRRAAAYGRDNGLDASAVADNVRLFNAALASRPGVRA